MERFGASMAKLSEAPAANPTAAALASSASATASAAASTEQNMVTEQAQPETSGRWAALRGYISATMEQNPAFANKS
jgi:hypothetical protein